MTSAVLAALVGGLALGFVEALGRFYPSPRTWRRLRAAGGNRAVRAMRERFEAAADRRTPRLLAAALMALVVGWVAGASLLDKRWFEVVFDVTPYVIVSGALLRTPANLAQIAARMKDYERDAGWDPDATVTDGEGPTAVAL